jgi:hypothetical protein
MANTTSVPIDVKTFLSFWGVESFLEDRKPNPNFTTKVYSSGAQICKERLIGNSPVNDFRGRNTKRY